MAKYEHLFFDLDHTLWDFETNSRATLDELFTDLGLAERGISSSKEFIEVYEDINFSLWEKYRVGKIDKAVLRVLRFRNALLQFGVRDDELARKVGDEYLDRCPHRTALMPGAIELLDYLRGKYVLHIITNGFQEVQAIKMEGSGLSEHFEVIITSEKARAKKPDPKIFNHAFHLSGAQASNSLMIGDSLVADVGGAKAVGMDQVHFDPHGRTPEQHSTYKISALQQLNKVL